MADACIAPTLWEGRPVCRPSFLPETYGTLPRTYTPGDSMAYALIAWDPPPGSDADEVDQRIRDALTFDGGARTPVHLLPRLVVYPSKPGGIGFSRVREVIKDVQDATPGLQIMIIMPDEGAKVAGWFARPCTDFDAARPIMNQGSHTRYPRCLG